MAKVYVVGPRYGIDEMFRENGWEVVTDFDDAGLIQFTGGEDVTPALYGEEAHPTTYNSVRRDAAEQALYNMIKDKPKAGICRGGQFLNVMSGGKMWQDVDRHAIGDTHAATDVATGKVFQVTSTHHQMMDPSPEATLLLKATRSTFKEGMTADGELRKVKGLGLDVESVFYPHTNALCFQPHPEFVNKGHECQTLYFQYIKDIFGLTA